MFWVWISFILFVVLLLVFWPLRSLWWVPGARGWMIVAVLVISAVTVGLYQYVGAYPEAHRWGSRAEVIRGLKRVLAAHPDSAHGWYLLGRLYITQQDYPQAVAAFQRAFRLAPEDRLVQAQLRLAMSLAAYP